MAHESSERERRPVAPPSPLAVYALLGLQSAGAFPPSYHDADPDEDERVRLDRMLDLESDEERRER